ncbi:hypothetical protein [Hydrogenophaga sp.]|uniref:hypothetical protein n=1 Tax=Hydrogenophaga sp. TaxID=1904254 RepID=UPI00286DFA18|nr:hypothetical protein [Hydrogenophaga sp.]
MEKAPLSFWILFAITIVGLASTQVLVSKLESRHPVTFAKLGSPHLFANNTPKNNWLYNRWLFSTEALLLDATISYWVWVNRVLAGSALLLFVFNIIKMFLG